MATETKEKRPSRAELSAKAKTAKVPYFRILNRAELEKVLADGVSEETVRGVISNAKGRWHSGWGKDGGRKYAKA